LQFQIHPSQHLVYHFLMRQEVPWPTDRAQIIVEIDDITHATRVLNVQYVNTVGGTVPRGSVFVSRAVFLVIWICQ
jgi:hypothetical protein